MQVIRIVNYIIWGIFLLCYSYQLVYIPIVLLFKNRLKYPETDQKNRYAILICARNEALVLPDLIESIRKQTYDPSMLSIFVMADNCSDNSTVEAAEQAGATKVYTRFNKEYVGKSYALKQLITNVKQDYPEGFDAFVVFDADNVLAPNYFEEMNKAFSTGKYEVLTSFRNSKNYGDNWISAGYALWFIRESRYLNHARALIHSSCAVSGTGFLFSRKVADEIVDWPFHLLTEDIEFSVYNISKGRKIGFSMNSELYDEQPVKFKQSWIQRLRWSRGYLQVYRHYGLKLFSGIFHGWFACYDMSMTIMPAFFLTTINIISNLILIIWGLCIRLPLLEMLVIILPFFFGIYGVLFLIGLITVITEWKRIRTTPFRKIFYCFTFPIFMFTYLPIAIRSLFGKITWKPIEHNRKLVSADGRNDAGNKK